MADYLRRGFPGAPAQQPAVPGASLWATQSPHRGPRSACYYPNAPVGKMPPGPLVCGAKSHSSESQLSVDECRIFVEVSKMMAVLCYHDADTSMNVLYTNLQI